MAVDLKFISSLQKDIDEISSDISDLMWNQKMFADFKKIVEANPKINQENVFYDFIKTGHVSQIVLAICRQIDGDQKVLSLMNLLHEISHNSDKITKDWFVSQYRGTSVGEGKGRLDFEECFGNLDVIRSSMVSRDIGKLTSVTKEIKKYRNKRIAHMERGEIIFNLDFTTLDKATEILDELGKKYYLLLHQKGMPSLLPVDQTDYRKIFRVQWINIPV